jgi:hypothetical protein
LAAVYLNHITLGFAPLPYSNIQEAKYVYAVVLTTANIENSVAESSRRDGKPAWELGEGLIIHHYNKTSILQSFAQNLEI